MNTLKKSLVSLPIALAVFAGTAVADRRGSSTQLPKAAYTLHKGDIIVGSLLEQMRKEFKDGAPYGTAQCASTCKGNLNCLSNCYGN